MSKHYRLLPFLLTLLPAGAALADLTVKDAWVRTAPPSADVRAAYLVLENSDDKPVEITAVSSPQFRKAEIHKTEMHNGMMRMTAVPKLTLAPAARLTLEPGGYHIMLFGTLGKEAKTVSLEFTTADGGKIRVQAPIRDDAGNDTAAGHHHGH